MEERKLETGRAGTVSVLLRTLAIALVLTALAGCGKGDSESGPRTPGRPATGSPSGGPDGGGRRSTFGPGASPPAAVPVETAIVERRTISSFIETNGTLEAENEVEIVARTSGPIVELRVEEGDRVRHGQILARLDDEEIGSQVEISRVNLEEARLAYERAVRLREVLLISPEEYEVETSRYETAKAQLEGNEIQLGYTVIRAPFAGLIIERLVQFAEQVGPSTPLFKLSDFDPLLCPIQVPERNLSQLRVDQEAYLTVEAWGDRRFEARVLRIRPVVESTTGTVKVTLEVESEGLLRPGMFARVFLQTATHENALVIPKAALSLESIGDTVYVSKDGVAERRDVSLGYTEGELVEILEGVAEREVVVTVGQDGLSDGTPIRILASTETSGSTDEAQSTEPAEKAMPGGSSDSARGFHGAPGGRPEGGGFDPSQMTPDRLELIKQRMRERGLSEEEIEEYVSRMEQVRRGPGSPGG